MFAKGTDAFSPFGRGRGGFGPFRAGRGMMEPAILGTLEEKPMHGYEIITYLEEKSHGMWRPSPGSVYPTLQLLEEKGHIRVSDESGKKTYELTDEGRAAAKEAEKLRERFKKGFNDRHHGTKDQRRIIGDVMRLMHTIHHKGTPEQQEALNEAFIAFKTRLEQITEGND